MPHPVTYDVTLRLRGPVLTHGSIVGGFGIDAPMAKDSQGYYLPGSLVKGRLREAWRELHEAAGPEFDPPKDLLGEGSGNLRKEADKADRLTVEPRRGKLFFSDFHACLDHPTDAETENVRYRIRIDEDRGSVVHGALLLIESPFAPGMEVCFKGVISFSAKDTEEETKILDWIERGLRFVPLFGAERTIGFGRLMGVTLSKPAPKVRGDALLSARPGDLPFIDMILRFDRPFCLSKKQIDGNLFESEETISGAVIKGVLAESLRRIGGRESSFIAKDVDPQRSELCEHFDKIRFTHAFPTFRGQPRPHVLPLSLALAGDRLYDLALHPAPELLADESGRLRAPAFQIDWKEKDWGNVVQVVKPGFPRLKKELRVRTAIDCDKRKAKDESLFAYEMVYPEIVGDKPDAAKPEWVARIDMSRVPKEDKEKVVEQLAGLLAFGLHGFGKTKVSAEAEWKRVTEGVPNDERACPEEGLYILVLQTPALLCNPDSVRKNPNADGLAYGETFKTLSDDALELVRYFAAQSLSGGYYLHRRFRDGTPYEPFILTTPGSVFVLKALDKEKAKKCVDEWAAHGLSIPQWAKDKYQRNGKCGSDWRNNPFIPENGFGEVAVNDDIHITYKDGIDLDPKKTEGGAP